MILVAGHAQFPFSAAMYIYHIYARICNAYVKYERAREHWLALIARKCN